MGFSTSNHYTDFTYFKALYLTSFPLLKIFACTIGKRKPTDKTPQNVKTEVNAMSYSTAHTKGAEFR